MAEAQVGGAATDSRAQDGGLSWIRRGQEQNKRGRWAKGLCPPLAPNMPGIISGMRCNLRLRSRARVGKFALLRCTKRLGFLSSEAVLALWAAGPHSRFLANHIQDAWPGAFNLLSCIAP